VNANLDSTIKDFFKKQFGSAPSMVVHAPGRLELIGNHTDYNQGLVMGIAVDKYISMAAAPRNDGKIELVSSAFTAHEQFAADDLKKNAAAPWANYVKGVLEQLRKRQIHYRGFNAALMGTIPMGSGMSSSAALEVATALTVRGLFPYSLTPAGSGTAEKLEIAKVCQAAENQFVGVQCGLLDQICSLFGKAAHAIEIDCQCLSVEHVPLLGEIAIVVCHSGVEHQLVGGEYNELRRQCEAAAQKLGVKFLRAVDPKTLEANRSKLSEREYQCAAHVVGEIQRVTFGARALRANDLTQFGQYMFQSHASSRDLFHNSTKELDKLVELAQQHPGCLGARLTGGGFGGATINLVKRDAAQNFMQVMAEKYQQQTGHKANPMLCQIGDGAK
jgi:galactokinase